MKLEKVLELSSVLCLSAMPLAAQETNQVEQLKKQLQELQQKFQQQQEQQRQQLEALQKQSWLDCWRSCCCGPRRWQSAQRTACPTTPTVLATPTRAFSAFFLIASSSRLMSAFPRLGRCTLSAVLRRKLRFRFSQDMISDSRQAALRPSFPPSASSSSLG